MEKNMSVLCLFVFAVSLIAAENSGIDNLITSNKLFTQSIYGEIAKNNEGKNFLVSPFSLETVLTLAQSGARGDSAKELRDVLQLSNNQTTLPNLSNKDLYVLHTANKLYVQNHYPIKNDFKKTCADVENIEFSESTEAAKTINTWVDQQTEEKIKNLISADSLDEHTKAILINAIYFKAPWVDQFKVWRTQMKNFYKNKNETIQVATLHHHEKSFDYYECPHLKAQFLELPFEGGESSMVIVLPNDKEGLTAVEEQLDNVFSSEHQLKEQLLNVALPKFKIETSTDFKEILKNLGVKKIFDRTQADLSGIAGKKGDLAVSKIVQKTFIDVNEGGVEAAAATYSEMSGRTLILHTTEPKDFIADHPFIFYIKVKGFIVFAGRITDPS